MNLHSVARTRYAGPPLQDARAAVIMLHGRGATADDMLQFLPLLNAPDIAFLVPQATGGSWYPHRFIAPLTDNQPYLDSALAVVGELAEQAAAAGHSGARLSLLGFSQGACLALEFTARNPRRYAGVLGFSGGLIGPPETDFRYDGYLDGTPVFLGCSESDPHIPLERVRETAIALRDLGAEVTERIYPGSAHTVTSDEVEFAASLMAGM